MSSGFRRRAATFCKRLLVAGIVAALVVYLFRATLLPPVAAFLDVSAPPQPWLERHGGPVYAVSLPGDDNTRTLIAARLVERGWASHAAVLQGVPSTREADGLIPPGAEVTRRVLLARGVAEQQIIPVHGESSDTMTDLQLLGHLLEDDPGARLVIVSNGYHLRRARWAAGKALGENADRVDFVAALLDRWDEGNWWKSEEGISSILSEYGKLAFYRLRY